MQKKHQWKQELLSALEVPDDLARKETIITLTGKNQAVIENYRSLLRYTEEEIVILTYRGIVVVRGKKLVIPCYTAEEMMIRGRFSEVILEQQEAKK